MVFEQKLKESEGVSPLESWRKNIPGTGERSCKGPGARACRICLKDSKGACGVQALEGEELKTEVREAASLGRDHGGPCEGFGFYSEGNEEPLQGFEPKRNMT